MLQSHSVAVGILCKVPLPGICKTRLIPLLGAEGAAELAACFIQDIVATILSVQICIPLKGYVVYAPEGSERILHPFVPSTFDLVCCQDGNLGVVLQTAIQCLLSAPHDIAVLVIGDSPTMPKRVLANAITAAKAPGDRLVIGPAVDGGYYLIALKASHAHLFENVPWSTSSVYGITERRAMQIGLEVSRLETWYDVDDEASFSLLQQELDIGSVPSLRSRGAPADATREFFQRHGLLRK